LTDLKAVEKKNRHNNTSAIFLVKQLKKHPSPLRASNMFFKLLYSTLPKEVLLQFDRFKSGEEKKITITILRQKLSRIIWQNVRLAQ
jgi:hypothetical protein